MPAIETNVEGIWFASQSAKGTPATTPTKHMRKVGGDVNQNPGDGSENYSDLDQFGNAQDYVDTLIGNGNPTIQATPDDLAYLLWLFIGAEAVTGTTNKTHAFVFGTSPGKWFTCWKRVGQSTVLRQRFDDCIISSLQIEGAQGSKVYHVTPTFLSLAGGTYVTADPDAGGVVAQTSEDAFLFTEGEGAYLVDGTALPTQQYTITMDRAYTPYYADGVTAIDVTTGNAQITASVQFLLNTAGLGKVLGLHYGTTTPSDGTAPIKTLPALGSLAGTVTKSAGRVFSSSIPGIRWGRDTAVAGNPDGSVAEVTLNGSMRKVSGQPAISLSVINGSAAYTA